MYFLSIESSTKNFAVAVSKDDRVLRSRTLASGKLLENSIIAAIDRILNSAKVKFEDLDAFAIGLGPGSFTSLRVGLSTIKAFAMATAKPMVGVCSLDVIAEGVAHLPCDEICVVVDARRNLVYSGLYQKTAQGLKLKGKYQLTGIAAVLDRVHGRTLFAGDALGLYRKDIEEAYAACAKHKPTGCQALFAAEKFWFPNARYLAKLSFRRLARKDYDNAGKLVPIYLYAHDCQVDKK